MPGTRQSTSISKNLSEEVAQAIDGAIAKHMDKLTQQITQLELKLAARDTHLSKLEDRVSFLENQNDALEQYGRRMNFRVENIPHVEGETPSSLEAQVIGILQEAGAVIKADDVVRLHRSTALRVNTNNNVSSTPQRGGVRSSQVIVKVNRWGVRESVHNSRNAARAKGTPIKQDLTKARRDLISEANEAIRGWGSRDVPVWAYANINCEPTMRRGKDVSRFSSDAELQQALSRFKP